MLRVALIMLAILLAGCGGTTTAPSVADTSPTGGAATTTGDGRVVVLVSFEGAASPKAFSAGSAALRAWVLDAASGQQVMAPLAFERSGGSTQLIEISGVPLGTHELLMAAVDPTGRALGWAARRFTVDGELPVRLVVSSASPLDGFAISPSSPMLSSGAAQALAAMAILDGLSVNVTGAARWDSETPTVATVSNEVGVTGRVAALQPGATFIRATLGDAIATARLVVDPRAVVSLAVSPAALDMRAVLERQALRATATYADGSTADVTASVSWSVDDAALLRLDGTAVAGRGRAGATRVTATLGGGRGSAAVTLRHSIFVLDGTVFRADDMQGTDQTRFIVSDQTGYFDYPTAMAIDAQGRIYVADTSHHRIVRFDDMSLAGFTAFGTFGDGQGQFTSPTAVALDAQGRVHVVDAGNARIVRIDDLSGAGWTTFGTHGTGTGQFLTPQGIAIDSAGRILVNDGESGQVIRFDDMQGTHWTTWGAGVLEGPWYFCLDAADRIHVADNGNQRIVRVDDMTGANMVVLDHVNSPAVAVDAHGAIYTLEGHVVTRYDDMGGGGRVQFGTPGTGPGQFQYPNFLCLDAQGRILVADSFNNRLQRIDDMSGAGLVVSGSTNPRDLSGDGFCFDSSGRIYVADSVHHRIVRFDDLEGTNLVTLSGADGRAFRFPECIALDAQERIYVTDYENHRVVRFDDMSGANARVLGSFGSGVGEFRFPMGIAVDASGRIYVSDQNPRVVRFDDMDGRGWTTFGSAGSGPLQLGNPSRVVLDDRQRILVCDGDNSRLTRMDDMTGTGWTVYDIAVRSGMRPFSVFVDESHIYYTVGFGLLDENAVYRMDDFAGANLVRMSGFGLPIDVVVR